MESEKDSSQGDRRRRWGQRRCGGGPDHHPPREADGGTHRRRRWVSLWHPSMRRSWKLGPAACVWENRGSEHEHSVAFLVPQIKAKIAKMFSGGANKGTSRATDQRAKLGGVSGSDSEAHPRAHRGPELPKKCRRRKRHQGKVAVSLRRSCLKQRWHETMMVRMAS